MIKGNKSNTKIVSNHNAPCLENILGWFVTTWESKHTPYIMVINSTCNSNFNDMGVYIIVQSIYEKSYDDFYNDTAIK